MEVDVLAWCELFGAVVCVAAVEECLQSPCLHQVSVVVLVFGQLHGIEKPARGRVVGARVVPGVPD